MECIYQTAVHAAVVGSRIALPLKLQQPASALSASSSVIRDRERALIEADRDSVESSQNVSSNQRQTKQAPITESTMQDWIHHLVLFDKGEEDTRWRKDLTCNISIHCRPAIHLCFVSSRHRHCHHHRENLYRINYIQRRAVHYRSLKVRLLFYLFAQAYRTS